MFSQASVILSTGGHAWQGVCVVGVMHGRGRVWQGGMYGRGGVHGRGACMAGETATAADGTHPTGMHSCFILYSSLVLISSVRLD